MYQLQITRGHRCPRITIMKVSQLALLFFIFCDIVTSIEISKDVKKRFLDTCVKNNRCYYDHHCGEKGQCRRNQHCKDRDCLTAFYLGKKTG